MTDDEKPQMREELPKRYYVTPDRPDRGFYVEGYKTAAGFLEWKDSAGRTQYAKPGHFKLADESQNS